MCIINKIYNYYYCCPVPCKCLNIISGEGFVGTVKTFWSTFHFHPIISMKMYSFPFSIYPLFGQLSPIEQSLFQGWPVFLPCIFWWRGNQSTLRKPTETKGKHANSTQKNPVPGGNQNHIYYHVICITGNLSWFDANHLAINLILISTWNRIFFVKPFLLQNYIIY